MTPLKTLAMVPSLPAAVHCLQDDQHGVFRLRVKLVLKLFELFKVLLRARLGIVLLGEFAGVIRLMVGEFEFLSRLDEEWGIDQGHSVFP